MSGGLKDQWGVGDAAQVGPDAQSQDLKNAFEKAMDAMADHLQYTAVNGDRARQDPLAARGQALVPRYQDALKQIDAADPAKAKPAIDSLLAQADAAGKDAAAFRAETEKAVNEWQSRSAAYDAAVKQVEEISEWQHPKEGAVRSLADAIRGSVNDHAFDKAVSTHDQFLPKLQPVYEDLQKQKAAQQQYEPALASLEPKLAEAAAPSFKKLASKQSEIASGKQAMETQAQGKDFVAAVAASATLNERVGAYSEEVKQIQQAKDQYEQALGGVQNKLQSAPSPSPFKKLEAKQAELSNGQKEMESSAQNEEFEQALAKANDLGGKADSYSEEVKQIQQAKDQYEQVLGGVQPKLQSAPSPSPFKKLEAMQAELSNGQKDMESLATSEEFEQALAKANDLGGKADSYSEQVKQIQQAKDQYEQVATGITAKVQAAPNPSPFKKLEAMQAELSNGQKDMESAATSEEFEQALAKANDLGTKADSYSEQVKQIQQAKDQYEQVATGITAKVQAAPNPSPFKKLEAMQAELSNGQKDMESAVTSEEFEQALQKATDLGTKADSYSEQVKQIQQAKDQYEQVSTPLKEKLQSAPSPSPFNKLEAIQAELGNDQKDMESSVQSEEFEQALQKANDLGTKADSYTEQIKQIQQAKDQYEQVSTPLKEKLQSAPNPSPFKKLEAMQGELSNGQKDMESAVTSEEFEQALQKANDLGTKADSYTEQIKQIQQAKDQYEQVSTPLKEKLQSAPNPSPFKKLEAMQAELSNGQKDMESAVTSEEFEQALQKANDLGTRADSYSEQVKQIQQAKDQYEQVATGITTKVQAAPNPSPFKKLEAMQAELSNGQKDMESSVQSEEFEQALQKANDLGTKADSYTEQIKQIQLAKDQYEQVSAPLKEKLQSAPSPSPFKRLEAMQAELGNGQKDMESAVQSEEFEQALTWANDLGTKADAYAEQVKQTQQAKDAYEQAWEQAKPKVEAARGPCPFPKTFGQRETDLSELQGQMRFDVQDEKFAEALAKLEKLGSDAEAITTGVAELQRQKAAYDQSWAQAQPKVEAARGPCAFPKSFGQRETDVTELQGQLGFDVEDEKFAEALAKVEKLVSDADAITSGVADLQRQKASFEEAAAQANQKVAAAPRPSPFVKLAPLQEALIEGQGQMGFDVQDEKFEQALAKANDLGAKADAYAEQVKALQDAKTKLEALLPPLQKKLDSSLKPSPAPQFVAQQAELVAERKSLEATVQSEAFVDAIQQAGELDKKVDAYLAAAAQGDVQPSLLHRDTGDPAVQDAPDGGARKLETLDRNVGEAGETPAGDVPAGDAPSAGNLLGIPGIDPQGTLEFPFEIKGPKSAGVVKLNKVSFKASVKVSVSGVPEGDVNVGPAGGRKSSDGKGSVQIGVSADAKKTAQIELTKRIDAMVNSLVKAMTDRDGALKTEFFAKAKAEAKAGRKEASAKLGYDFGVDATVFGVGKISCAAKFTLAGLKYKPSDTPPVAATVLAAEINDKLAVKWSKAFVSQGKPHDIEGSVEWGAEIEPNWAEIAKDALADVGASVAIATVIDAALVAGPPLLAAIIIAQGIYAAGEKGALEAGILDGALDARQAAMAYAQTMTGSEGVAPGPRAQAAVATAKKELSDIAQAHQTTVDEVMTELRKMAPHPDFRRIYEQARQQIFTAYKSEIRKAVKAWRKEHYVLAGWTTEADDINSADKKVEVVFSH